MCVLLYKSKTAKPIKQKYSFDLLLINVTRVFSNDMIGTGEALPNPPLAAKSRLSMANFFVLKNQPCNTASQFSGDS